MSDIKPTQRDGYAERQAADKLKKEDDLKNQISERVQTLVYLKGDLVNNHSPVEKLYVINDYGNGDVKLYGIETHGALFDYLEGDMALSELKYLKEQKAKGEFLTPEIERYVIYENKGPEQIVKLSELSSEMSKLSDPNYKTRNVSFSFPTDKEEAGISITNSKKTELKKDVIDFINKKNKDVIKPDDELKNKSKKKLKID